MSASSRLGHAKKRRDDRQDKRLNKGKGRSGIRKAYDESLHVRDQRGQYADKPGAGDDAPKKPKRACKSCGAAVGKEEHVYADSQEKAIAKAVGGTQLDDNEPLDVRVKRPGGKEHAIEVKSLLKGKKKAISVHDDALLRKVDYAAKNPGSTFHTVALDHREKYRSGIYKENYSGHDLYYKRGSGRYSLSQMHRVKDDAELKRLLDTPDNQLPEKARGSLPSGDVADLRVKAAKAHDSRLKKDRARRQRLLKARKRPLPLAAGTKVL